MQIVLRSVLVALPSTVRTRASLQREILALRHQLGILQRNKRRRIRLGATERLLWVALHRLWPEWRKALVLIKPDTVIAWLSFARIPASLILLTLPRTAADTSSHDPDPPAAPLPSPDRRTAPV